jgi:hypothetical protein
MFMAQRTWELRLNPADYAGWVSKALSQRTDSASTRRLPPLPLIDDFDIAASFATAERTFERIKPSQVKLILSPKQREKPAESTTRTCANAAVCVASGECPSRF